MTNRKVYTSDFKYLSKGQVEELNTEIKELIEESKKVAEKHVSLIRDADLQKSRKRLLMLRLIEKQYMLNLLLTKTFGASSPGFWVFARKHGEASKWLIKEYRNFVKIWNKIDEEWNPLLQWAVINLGKVMRLERSIEKSSSNR